MGIEYLKRWQWMLLGLIVGLALAFMTQASKPGDDGWTGRTVGQQRFERSMSQKPINGNPIVKNVRLFPSEVSEATGQTVAVIAFDELMQVGETDVWKYVPTRFIAAEPIKAWRAKDTEKGTTIKEYLSAFAIDNPAASVRYAWWSEPRNAYLLWSAGGVVVLGVIWPTILNMLIGAGLGRAPVKKEPKVDLSKLRRPDPVPQPVAAVKDDGALEKLNASLEQELAAAGVLKTGGLPDPDDSTAGEPVIKPLTAGPLETAAETNQPAAKPSENFKGGIFYPVARGPAKPD